MVSMHMANQLSILYEYQASTSSNEKPTPPQGLDLPMDLRKENYSTGDGSDRFVCMMHASTHPTLAFKRSRIFLGSYSTCFAQTTFQTSSSTVEADVWNLSTVSSISFRQGKQIPSPGSFPSWHRVGIEIETAK